MIKSKQLYLPKKVKKKNNLFQINKLRKELTRNVDQDILKICKSLCKDLREILKDGYPNGKEKATKRKAKKELERHKVWQLSENKKQKMFSRLTPVPVQNRSLSRQLKRENDYGILDLFHHFF